MYRMFKVYVLILISMAHLLSLGMNRALATERARRHFDRLAEDSNKTKLLEHPCFPGESLNFQNDFFSSNYMDLPGRIASPIVLMTQDVPVDQRRFVFMYYARYRKKCHLLIEAFDRAAIEKAMLYQRHAQKLMGRPDSREQLISLDRMAEEDMYQRGAAMGKMTGAFDMNDYFSVLEYHKKYCDMSKSY